MKGITHIKETCLYIQDIDKAVRFYHHCMGFPIITKVDGRHVFFRAGNSVLLCFLADVTKCDQHLPPHFAYGNQHLAFEVPKNEYEYWKSKLINAQVKIIHQEQWRGSIESFYFNDLEENVLEIVQEGMWEI